jgi:hypothetical protein
MLPYAEEILTAVSERAEEHWNTGGLAGMLWLSINASGWVWSETACNDAPANIPDAELLADLRREMSKTFSKENTRA